MSNHPSNTTSNINLINNQSNPNYAGNTNTNISFSNIFAGQPHQLSNSPEQIQSVTHSNIKNSTSNSNLSSVPSNNCFSISMAGSNSLVSLLQQIFDKVRTLCKECDLANLPSKLSANDIIGFMSNNNGNGSMPQYQIPLSEYISSLDQLRTKIYEYNQLEQQYKKLQSILQRNQTQIRKHIATEQQFKLYVDNLKSQYQQSENERLELLDNSKQMIKQLKMQNQKLFQEIQVLKSGDEDRDSRWKNKDKDSHKDREKISQMKSKEHSKKAIPGLRNKQRLKSQYCSSLNVNHHRNLTEGTFITPGKQKQKEKVRFTQNRERNDFTQRQQNSKKRKLGDIKKRHNYTVMAYMSNKKKQSKQKETGQHRQHYPSTKQKQKLNIKKTLISFSDRKQVNFNYNKNREKDRQKQLSGKKVHRSILSLESIDYNDE